MKLPSNLKWKSTGKILGQGGQATVIEVYLEDDEQKKPYALKALSKDRPEKAYKRFVKEVEAIKQIDHPYIIKIFDHSNADSDFHFYVMELISNSKSLKKLLDTDQNPFYGDTIKSLNFFMNIMAALSACSSSKIIHRDLSPANILITENESIKIIDFGLCQIDDRTKITLSDEGVGTQNYMAPECESGMEGSITQASDIYSAGKLLWSAITNQFAFARESPVFNEQSMYTLFDERHDTYHLHHIFEKSIRFNPKDRWQQGYDAYRDCQKILNIVKSGYPPLELIDSMCPVCGFGNPEPFKISNMVYGYSQNIKAFQCTYCGHIFHYDYTKKRDNLNLRKDLK